jgi:hypothetical protein
MFGLVRRRAASQPAAALRVLATVAVAGALVLAGGPAMADGSGTHHLRAYRCAGGEIPSGRYASITVTGACSVAADAVITVFGDVTVRKGAVLDAQSAPSTITVFRNVSAAKGSLLGLGCQPPSYTGNSGHPCTVEPDGHSVITVFGDVTATKADTVLLNGITVAGNVRLVGGGGEIPWSIKNNTIGRNVLVRGQTAEWVGLLFNRIGGSATLLDITLHDVDPGAPGVYVVRNTIRRNLVCFGLNPGVSGGFVPGEVNVVGHRAIGQCASLV